MRLSIFASFVIIIIIIVGGIIIVVPPIPEPEPICIVCGSRLIDLLGIAEMVLGVAALVALNRIANTKNGNIRG